MKTTFIHGTPSGTMDTADSMRRTDPDTAVQNNGLSTPQPGIMEQLRASSASSRVSLLFATLAMLLGVWMLAACSDDLPDLPVDPPTPTVPDTTGHDFVWTVDTIGIELDDINDVAIISEDEVWVVGQFDQRGDDGNIDWSKRGNTARWDGKKWTIHRITDGTYIGGGAMETVFATGPDNIWIMGSGGLNFDGTHWTANYFSSLGYRVITNSMWTSHDNTVQVFVGNSGNLVYKHQGTLSKHKSAPHDDFRSVDNFSNGDVLIGGGLFTPEIGRLYRMTPDGELTHIFTLGKYIIEHVDVVNDAILFSTLRRLYRFDGQKERSIFESDRNIRGMKANAMNDVFMITNSSTVWHYNGVTVRDIGPDFPDYCMGMGLCVQGDLIYFVAIGNDQRALVFRGERRD